MSEARIKVSGSPGSYRVELFDAGNQLAAGSDIPPDLPTQGSEKFKFTSGAAVSVPALDAVTKLEELMPDDAEAVGGYLYSLLTPGGIADQWAALCQEHPDGLATLLEIEPGELRRLPWELLHKRPSFLFQDLRYPLGLRIPQGQVSMAARHCWPLRMLVLVGSTDPDISAEAEVLAIRHALSAFSVRIELKIHRAPTSKIKVAEEIRTFQPHLLHFISHGSAAYGGQLMLTVEREVHGNVVQTPEPWSCEDVHALLAGLPSPPQIVVINACESGGTMAQGHAIADAFAKIGCPVVIAMRGDIFGKPAVCFSSTFYRTLAKNGLNRPDKAYCQAISDVSNEITRGKRLWPLPRIYFQDRLANVFYGLSDCRSFSEAHSRDSGLLEIKPFVNRESERSILCHAGNAWLAPGQPNSPVLLIQGGPQIGKSWLLKWLVYIASLRGFKTFHWDFETPPDGRGGSRENYDLDDVLSVLRNGDEWPNRFFSKPLCEEPLASDLFAAFDRLAEQDMQTAPLGNEDTHTPKVRAFAEGLKKLAMRFPDTPILIALDHIGKVIPEIWKDYLSKELVLPLAKGKLGKNLRLAMVCPMTGLGKYGFDGVGDTTLPPLGLFDGCQFKKLLWDYLFHFLRDRPEEDTQKKIQALDQIIDVCNQTKQDTSWEPHELAETVHYYKLMRLLD